MPDFALTRRAMNVAVGVLLSSCCLAAAAQNNPTRPVRIVVPWPPGTPADVAGRIVAEHMAAGLGQPVVVENKPGAVGTIGMLDALRQPADGYTLYLLSSASLVAPLLYPAQKIDFQKSLDVVGHLSWNYNVLAVAEASPHKSTQELVQAAKARPGELNFGSGGNGTPAHLAGELFKQQTGTQMTHVPYNQFTMAVSDLLAGRVDFMFLTATAAIPQIAGGKLRALGTTGSQRLPLLKGVATMTEQGYSNFVLRSFDMVTVKAGTPRPIVERLNSELNRALANPGVKDRLDALALDIEPMTPAQSAKVLATESDKWMQIGRSAQIKVD